MIDPDEIHAKFVQLGEALQDFLKSHLSRNKHDQTELASQVHKDTDSSSSEEDDDMHNHEPAPLPDDACPSQAIPF